MSIKLSKWAKNKGISYKTAYRWVKNNQMPCSFTQTETGTILVHDDDIIKDEQKNKVVVYCRVSSADRKKSLDNQVDKCVEYANKINLNVDKIYKEVASGMNDKRTKLIQMLNYKPSIIIVENKDRLTRFGFNYLDLLLKQLNCKIIVVNQINDDEKDLMTDLISIITSFCCRLYGLRRGKNKAKKIKEEMENER